MGSASSLPVTNRVTRGIIPLCSAIRSKVLSLAQLTTHQPTTQVKCKWPVHRECRSGELMLARWLVGRTGGQIRWNFPHHPKKSRSLPAGRFFCLFGKQARLFSIYWAGM
jgi:hypothetical protein